MNLLPSNLYKNIIKNLSIVCVDVYIYNVKSKKFLLVKRKNEPQKNKFCCTGGRVLKGEDLNRAALRKIREELGVNIATNKLKFLGITNTIFKNSTFEGIGSHTVNASFLYSVESEGDFIVKLSNESSCFEWKKGSEPGIVKYVKLTICQIKKLNFSSKAIYLNFKQK